MNRVQDAINDLRDYLENNHLHSGSVYIAAGTYVPTESTESTGGSMLNTSFKIYAGIHVYGGFNAASPESRPGLRMMANGKTCEENWADQSGIGTVSGTEIASQWDLRYKTILSGNHSSSVPTFTFDSIRGKYTTAYAASSYHVVWFATNGIWPATDDLLKNHYKPLEYPASIDGCVISSGNAASRNINLREHTGYGGGVYMVGNSSMRGCIVERCSANMRGGGIYADGGGTIEFCYVHTCQSAGIGVYQGYGGGVCIDHEGSIGHSQITSCASRCGGGIFISHVPEDYPVTGEPAVDNISNYSPYATACVVNNNTTNAEGAGIYLAEGGTVNHCTVTANNCMGPDVTYYGRRHGRTGGIYVRNCGQIFNSVFWGNRCDVNNDIQFASVRQKTGVTGYETFVYHTAFMNHDITDWTGVRKESVYSLDKQNMPVKGGSDNFPCFFSPTITPLNWDSVNTSAGIYGAGVLAHMRPVDYPGPRIWHLTSHSYLDQKGVQWSSAMVDPPTWLIHAHTDYGVVSNPYEPASTLGALVRKPDNMRHALIAPQGMEGRKDATPIPTVFVDLSHEGDFDGEGRFRVPDHSGDSWDAPLHSIGDALMYYRTYLVETPGNAIGSRAHYHLPSAWDPETGNPTAYTDYDYVQMLVKEGEQSTAGPNNYLGKDMRTASIRTLSHMRLYGGYPKTLTGTDTEGRNPLNHPTVITANIADEKGEGAYANNSAHVFTYVNTEYTIVDGFQLLNGNAHNLTGTRAVMGGGGVLVSNEITDADKRIDMVGNELRNCRLANNSAPRGAAIYVTGDSKKRIGFYPVSLYAELKVVNCIIRNNTAHYNDSEKHGIVTANGRAFIDIDHCDIVNNVGYPLQSDNHAWRSGEEMPYNGYIRVDNSIIYCNGTEVLNDRSMLPENTVLSVDATTQDYIFGTYNMFDADIKLHHDDATQPHGFFKSGFSVPSIAGVLPAGMPDAANHPLTLAMPAEKYNQCILTRTNRNAATYPVFVNPSRNIGHSAEGDRPLFGGKVSFIPLNNNPCVNAASVSAYGANNVPRPDAEDFDLTDYTRRNYGGEPDMGALEDTDLPPMGAVIYVTPEGAGKRDGSSWANAIAGNTVYVLNDIAGPALADGDQIDSEATCNRVLDSEGNPRLTTDSLYCGGWGKVWIAGKTVTGKKSLTRQIHTVEKKIYIGGDNDGDEIPIGEPTDTEISNSETLSAETPSDFTPGYEYDTRYPYGEISGASRSFWRANPYHNGTDWNNGASYANKDAFIKACNTNGWINNARSERYVSGLQYAVEKASAANKTAHENTVQVWVGAGKYTDYKGYVMRDSVTVMGGFPTNKYAAPGLNERQALMSDVVSIPKSKPAADFEATDYETILQLSDVNPKQDNTHLNSEAVKYWDDDYTSEEIGDIETTQIEEVTITHPFRWIASSATEVSSDYIRYPDMYMAGKAGNNVFSDRHKCDKNGNTANNITMSADEVFGGYTWASGTTVVYQYFGSPWKKTDMGNNQSWELCYQDVSGNVNYSSFGFNSSRDVLNTEGFTIDSDPRGMALSGYMSTMSAWQTMKNVPAGSYKLVIDLGAYYESYPTENNTGITFYIIASNGDTLAEQPVFCNSDKLLRYEFTFVQPTIGDLTIRMMSAPGTKHATPSNDANKRKVSMSNVHLYVEGSYEYVEEPVINDTIIASQAVVSSLSSTYTKVEANHRITLRKRVLTMPDICVPTYGAGSVGNPSVDNRGKYGDDLAHTDRVFGSTKEQRTAATSAKQEDPQYVEYNEANWDGFTIRHGFLADENMAHGGGAGVNMYEGGHLRNCLVVDNFAYCGRVKGGGMFCDGATSTIEGCFVLNNTSSKGTNTTQDQIFAGGLFMYEGTCFNSLFANNYSYGSSGGLGFCVGRFYNNTVAYNTATLKENSKISGGAVSLATASNPNLFVANTIIFGNNGVAIRDRNTGYQNVNPFLHCYIQSEETQPNDATKKNVTNWTESNTNNYGIGNTFLNGVAPSAANTPFAADFDEEGNYVAGRAASLNDFRLRDDFYIADQAVCVNHGTEEFAVEFKQALTYKGKTESDINSSFVYKSVAAAELPNNDVAFAKRVQDCQIDMGAYEFNAAYSIKPDTTTHPGKAIYYVTFDAHGGDASADSPENAACKQKLQLVLDAAGRYKYNLMTLPMYNKGEAGTYVADQPNKHWSVEVWLEGDDINSTVSDEYADWYTATRSTKHNMETYVDNTLDYSFIIPHGIQVKGGYSVKFFHYEDAAGNEVEAGTPGATVKDERDPLTYRTVLSGKITSSTGAEGNTFHVVTFTNDLFTPEEEYYMDGDNPIRNQLAFMTDEKDRAVVDGLFIMDGHANSPDMADRIGAAAVVTNYAHIRNCVIQENTAEAYGGGLYLKPFALVSGTIIKHNTAETGGGVYIEAPSALILDSLARVFSSTICENTARSTAGGMYFDNTYARVNSTALWHNEANDYANISGVFSRSSEETDYPLNFCAVESRRLEGQGNVELSPKETEGVRWDRQDPFNDILYYPIEMSSTLSRAGMTYNEWRKTMGIFTTLDSVDIAGVSRTKWNSPGTNVPRGYAWGSDTLVTKNNDFIEIGARAINKNFAINIDPKYVMNRLYVMHTDLINSEAARALQDNTATDDASNMYRQMGSCILNPFHRLGDAFDYIIAARKSNPALYRNRVFEVFIEQGIYYPYHNAYGEQDEVRNNTFLIPEGIYVIGGIDSRPEDHHYGQEGYFDMFTGAAYGNENDVTVAGYTIHSAPLDSIRLRDERHRPMRDNNLNSVIEPWELERQTILSGNAVAGEDFTHVYHVITMHADSNHVGPQPLKFRHLNPDFDRNNLRPGIPMLIDPIPMDKPEQFVDEIDLSILGRTTEFDGIQITGGYANHLNPEDTVRHPYVKKTYFQGGGIFVDGNWDEDFNNLSDKLPNATEPAKYNIPIVVENSFFTNNMAGNGGAVFSNGGIYMYGCHFVQNYSQGPMTEIDQRFISWTAGGCIATNAFCGISNTLFDNNEARRGLYPITVSGEEEIPHADARQGFGGVLSVASQARARIVNCHFMKNKAVAYPSIYNFNSNHRYSDPDSMQFAFNTIFWGNEVFEVESLDQLEHIVPPTAQTIKDFNDLYKKSRKGVFHYDGTKWENYERLFHEYDSTYAYWTAEERRDTFNTAVTDKLAELRAQGDELEGLYFCSYRKTYGPSGMKPTAEGYLLTKDEQRNFVDPRQKPVQVKIDHDFPVEDFTNLYSYVHGNNNTLINPINTATDGPNFKQPSFIAGIDGYMQNADWLIARMNLTTDQGWGHLKQTVVRGVGYFLTRYTGTQQFDTYDEALAAANTAVGEDTCTAWSVLPVHGLPVASFDDEQEPIGPIYNWYSRYFGTYMSDVNAPLPIKDQYYMAYSRTTNDDEVSGNMDRISKRPKIGQTDTYIDVGIYEYQYVQLNIKGQEIDTMWVATKTKDAIRHDGLTWETPTTDLQSAIDVLMSSHNNHDKYVCFLGDDEGGTFSPSDVIDNRRAFIITSNTLEPLLPDSAEADHDYGVNSLTFLGGYSFDVKDAPRDPQAHPVVVEMPNAGTLAQRNQLFVVEDMTRQMVQANWQGEYTSRDSVVIPIVFDGITFINPYSTKDPSSDVGGYNNQGGLMSKKGGAAIYYRWQRRYEGQDGAWSPNFKKVLHPDSALIDGVKTPLPKLTLSNCIFMDNGDRTVSHNERSAAVRIDHGGGSSLIVNSLFHSNAGAPVYARTYEIVEEENDLASVPNDVVIVNSTSALNDGHIRLEGGNSEVHNSLIWLDDLDNDTTIQLQMGASDQWDKAANRTRQGIENRMTNNAVWGCFMQPGNDPWGNDSLVTANNDIYGGPGFMLPYVTASTSEQRRERSFRLNPSLMTQNMADTVIYRDRVFFRVYPDTCAGTHNQYWRRSNGFKSTFITTLANDSDLAAKPRLSGDGMERGAYECLAVLQRVLYVQPTLAAFAAGDGSSWEHPFGQGQLQNAIDAAAVYTYLRQADPKREDRKAYVFVKGSYDTNEHMDIKARDGVYVFGSLPSSFNDTAVIDPDLKQFTNAECQRFVNYVRASSTGVASPNATPTRVNSVHVEGDDFNTGFLFDGFVITNPKTELHVSPVILDNEMTAMRNCLITDNKVVGDLPVVDVTRGLLYNNLIYGDSASAIVKVGANGLALNNTIVTDEAAAEPTDVTGAAAGAVVNNIALNTAAHASLPFAPYFTARTPYALPDYLTENKPLAFQLHEHSALIHAGTADDALEDVYDTYVADSTIAFRHDRDVLGNPRKIGSAVDIGALETWRVEKNGVREITARTNKAGAEAMDVNKYAAYLDNYGGNDYPHPGSVVYLMDSAAMSMQYEYLPDFVDLKTGAAPLAFRPGFMLLKPGASFYGNGHNVQMNYIAAEKRFKNQRYSMTAFPFPYSETDIAVSAYDKDKDSLILQISPFSFNTYQYAGAARSAKDYVFQPTNSSSWLAVNTPGRTAADGYLMDFGAVTDTVLRFNAFAPSSGEYIYTEDGEDKTISLTQYDHRTGGTGADLNFTTQENMGWNMKGLPWLVSYYRTDTILWAGNYLRQMYIPHVIYQMDGSACGIAAGDQAYTLRSWDKGATVAMGNAFLTQTATKNDQETVVFHQPYYDRNKKIARPAVVISATPAVTNAPARGATYDHHALTPVADMLTLIPDSTVSSKVQYAYGRDGIKWTANENLPQMYAMDAKGLSRLSLLGAAPVEVDIPVGLHVPDSYNGYNFTFSLPDKEPYEPYPYVWLIDYEAKTFVNLQNEDYTLPLEAGEYTKRFAIRIGGFKKNRPAATETSYVIFASGGTLYVRGTQVGDRITVYTTAGQLVASGMAEGDEWTMLLPLQTGYIVRVNNTAQKVLNR